MKDTDRDLIAALAEGSLPADEAVELQARIADDPAAQAELEAQRAALTALAAASPPRLTEAERDGLHRALAEQLGLETDGEVAPAPRSRRFRLNWAAVTVAAAAVFVIVLIAPLTSLLNTSDGDDAAEVALEMEDEAAPATTTAPAETAAALEGAGAQQRDGGTDTAAVPPAAPVETTVAADSALAAEAPSAGDVAVPDAGVIEPENIDGFLRRFLVQSEEFDTADDGTAEAAVAEAACGAEAAAAAPDGASPPVPLATLALGETDAVVWGSVADPSLVRFVVLLGTEDCSELAGITAPAVP